MEENHKITCPRCGKKIPDYANKCKYCDFKLQKNTIRNERSPKSVSADEKSPKLISSDQKSACSVCSKPSPQPLKEYKIYSAIENKSERKTGFKQYEITTQTFLPQLHLVKVCQSCRNKYELIYPGIIIVGAVILATWLSRIDFLESGLFLTILCLWVPLIGGAFKLISDFFGLDPQLKRVAVKERERTDWKTKVLLEFDPRFARSNSNAKVIGLTERQFQKLFKKKS